MNKKTIEEAIIYIYSKKYGVYEDLIEEFGKDIVNSLCVTGLIKKRQENTSVNSWKITNEGLNFIINKQENSVFQDGDELLTF